ncbi:MAG TPA: hypothetical protein VGF69_23810 [Thermoanaerobaculia bacterium]|jgi:hypothetical protein
MRRTLLALGLTILAAGAEARGDGFNVSVDVPNINDCSDFRITTDGQRLPVVSQDVPVSGTVRIASVEHGGIYVRGGASRTTVTACKASRSAGASDVRVTQSNGSITADGPDGDNWTVFFLVRTARGAALDLETRNGPITLRDVEARVTARAINGPIALRDSSGTIDLETTNGPISITGGSGDVKARAQNGPLAVNLSTGSWIGSLEGSTENGPLSLKLADNYRSGVVVEARGHSPVVCKVEGCPEAKGRYQYDEVERFRPRRFELGNGPANVHLSTNNGPVVVKALD